MLIQGQFKNLEDLWNNHIKSEEYESQNKRVIAFTKKNTHGYVLYEDPVTHLKTIDTILARKTDEQTWSYRSYNEQSYPFYFLCTKTLISQSTNPHPRAVLWRKKCEETISHILNKRKIQSYIGEFLKEGMILHSHKYGAIRFIEYTHKKKGFKGYHLASKQEFIFRFGLFQLEELEQFINNAIHHNQHIALKAS